MSDQQPPEKKKPTKSNPLEGLGGSSLFSSSTPTTLPQLPSMPTQQPVQPVPTPEPQPAPPVSQQGTQQPSMLWNTPPSADLVLRDFIQRHDKQAIYVDVRYAGALAALAKLVHKGNKTDMLNEMIEDMLNKYSQVLIEREDVVRAKEDEIRKKHHID